MSQAQKYLEMAARAAMRSAGDVEPNPMVGAVVVKDGEVVGIGHHRRFGDLHAERDALRNCNMRGVDVRGAEMYVTLEPCSHVGKQPPCVNAVIEAGIRKVVMARRDPNPVSGGGLERLRDAGVAVEVCDESAMAIAVSNSFVRNVAPAAGKQGLPWVVAKWAQTIDGRIATRTGESKWISNPLSRRRVHNLRARMDAIVTGIGTVIDDDPMLTARDVSRVRRMAKRVVLDSRMRIRLLSKLVKSAEEAPLIVMTTREMLASEEGKAKRLALSELGVEVCACDGVSERVDVSRALMMLKSEYGCTNVMIESGPTLLGSLFEADVVDEAIVYIAPLVLGDDEAYPSVCGRRAPTLAAARRLDLLRVKRLRGDLELWYRRAEL